MKKSIKRPRKLRCLMAIIAFSLVVVLMVSGFSAQADANNFTSERKFTPVYVVSGDTLWSLVEEYYDYQGDIRKAINEVKKINNLDNASIQQGQIIYIPEA